jgi:hypothetical protein
LTVCRPDSHPAPRDLDGNAGHALEGTERAGIMVVGVCAAGGIGPPESGRTI